MSRAAKILEDARARASNHGLPYSGAVTPDEAHALLADLPRVQLIDVRCNAEWQFVGAPPAVVKVEWRTFPGMVANAAFLAQLKQQVDPEAVLLFLCRSGVRSHDAAACAAAHGLSECYNVLEGFEGDKNSEGQRGRVNGWKGRQLPWSQS